MWQDTYHTLSYIRKLQLNDVPIWKYLFMHFICSLTKVNSRREFNGKILKLFEFFELWNGDNFQIFICLKLCIRLNLTRVIGNVFLFFFMTNRQKSLRRLLGGPNYRHLARGSAILYSLLSNDAARLDRMLAVMLGRINWSLWNKIASRRQNMFPSLFSV